MARADRIRDAENALLAVFKRAPDKREANRAAKPILEQLTREPEFLTAVLERYLATPGSLDKTNYPVVGIDIALNPWFGLVANCWIPLPGHETHLSTKAIHHHGPMLLSTATLFGPGYEHWMFSLPKPLSDGSGLFGMDLLEAAPHPQHHVSFVDAWIAHTPLFPRSLSITLALWSNSEPTTWRDRVKRLPLFQGREESLRRLAVRLGMKRSLGLKVVDSYDYYPTDAGFEVMRERKEFERGPIEDHVCNVFHVVQETGNEHLARTVRRALDDRKIKKARTSVTEMIERLERGTPIEGRLSRHHYELPYANFTRDQIERALATAKAKATEKGGTHGGQLAAEARS
jgi:hypothetical protein